MVGWVLLLASCGGSEPARRYADAATLALTDPVAAAAACEDVGPELRDECLCSTARVAAKTDLDLAAQLCGRSSPSLWRDECWFVVAEATVPARGGEEAAKGCANAGRFAMNCLDHVWRAHASSLLAEGDPASAAARYAEARGWASAYAAEDRQLEGRFWQKFYDAPLHDASLPTLDSAWCAQMSGALGQTCRNTMPAALRHTLNRMDRERQTQGRPIDRVVLCAESGDDASRIRAALGVTYVAGGALDDVAAHFVASRCGWIQPGSAESQHAGDDPDGVR